MRLPKLLEKARRNPSSLSFAEFCWLLQKQGWRKMRQGRTSHMVWQSPGGYTLPIQQQRGGTAKFYQVEQFLDCLEAEDGS